MVGTHFPDDRDVLESALQRMREAFEALRDGQMSPARAEEEFLGGYDTARDLVSAFFLARRMSPGRPAAEDELARHGNLRVRVGHAGGLPFRAGAAHRGRP